MKIENKLKEWKKYLKNGGGSEYSIDYSLWFQTPIEELLKNHDLENITTNIIIYNDRFNLNEKQFNMLINLTKTTFGFDDDEITFEHLEDKAFDLWKATNYNLDGEWIEELNDYIREDEKWIKIKQDFEKKKTRKI